MKKLNQIIIILALAWAAYAFTGCTKIPPKDLIAEASKCEVVEETLKLTNQTVTLPVEGRMVLESHLATKEDTFPGRSFPNSIHEGILDHMNRSCERLKKFGVKNCLDVYAASYHRQWTPPEFGLAGQGSIGNRKPTVDEEMWLGNMYWTRENKPAPGTKFLASRGDRSVVVVMGYETGPRDPKFIGGLQGEAMWWLRATNADPVRLGRLKDQSVPPGPITCP